MSIKIDNTPEEAIQDGKWSNPGASFYNTLIKEENASELIDEAYLMHGDIATKWHSTPFSRSGCKYPHHSIKDGKLVISIPGLKAAYNRACQMRVFNGDLKKHIEMHAKQLGIADQFHYNETMDQNFYDVEKYIMENTDYDLSDDLDFYESKLELFNEASHGKLKFDFRLGWDAKTGHQIKVIYSLNNINVTDVGDFYYNYAGKKDGATHDSHLDYTRKNITKKGNTDHQSTGQKVLAIIDMVTKSKLQEVDLLNPFCDSIDTHMLVQAKENLKKANQYALSNPDSKSHLQVGKIDNTKSFKSTTWSKARTTDSNGEDFRFQGIASAEELKHGRGWKVHNIIPERFKLLRQNDGGFVFKENPTKEEAITELKVRHEHNMRIIRDLYAQLHAGANNPNIQSVINELNMMNNEIVSDYNTIKSGSYNVAMMKKYRTKKWDLSFKESYINSLSDSMPSSHEIIELNESLDTVKTPADFLLFMNDIEYGWVDKEGNRYEDADDGDFFKDYRLQSPKHLLESKLGVCWDQVELEREWFTDNGYKFRTFFIAIDDGEGKPSHTFLIYQEGNKVYWFENSWYDQRGIHKFNNINDAIKDIFDKFNKSKDNTEYPIYLYELPKMPEGITCKDYYIQATDSKNLIQKIEMNKITEAAEDSNISDPWFIRSDDGVDNCCIKVKGYDKPMRGRSAMITLKLDEDDHWYVLCKKNADDYGVPGGGWNKNETPEQAAIRELQEETLSNVKDVKRMGTLIEYHTKVKDWVKEHVPNKNDWWYGYYSAVFVGIYDGEYKGKVKSEDRESGYAWKPVDYKLMKEFPKEYSDAINDYINNVHFSGYIVKCESDTINKKYGYKYDQYYLLVGNKRVAEVKVLKKEKFMFDAETYKEFRRRGYMEYLVKYLVTYKGVRHLNVALDNKAAISLYKKIGFKDDGFVRGDNDEKLQRMSISESDVKNINFSLKESVDILDESISDSVAQMLPPMTSGKKESEKDIMKKFMELEEDENFIEFVASNGWEAVFVEEGEENNEEEISEPEAPISRPKETDKKEKNKNGVRRKALYMAFIDFAKSYNNKNTFGSIFDKDAFNVTYPFVPHDMRYFYRLANPILCVLEGDLTFFQVSELGNMNSKNKQLDKYLIFAATENDLRVYNNDDRGVYFATSDEDGNLTIGSKLGDTFDLYIQEMIKQGDILNAS